MAILKHIASKNANYHEAYEYMIYEHNEEDGRMLRDERGDPVFRKNYLIEGINCLPETFAMECRRTNQSFHKNKSKEEIKNHHYIISFAPRDRKHGLTMAKAQKLGMEFAKKNFPGHQAIVATHDDGNGNHSKNIHCHIVINSVRAYDAPELKYEMRPCDMRAGYKHNCTRAYLHYLEGEVVKMCTREGYHQVDFQHVDKRITSSEYKKVHHEQKLLDEENEKKKQQGMPVTQTKFESEKEKLRGWIEAALTVADSEEDFKKRMKNDYGVEVKASRGRISYRMPGKEKFIRARKLGDKYERENILEMIKQNQIKQGKLELPIVIEADISSDSNISDYTIGIVLPVPMGRLIDIEHNEKIKNSPAYEQWAKIHNLQLQAELFHYMSQNQFLGDNKVQQEYEKITRDLQKVHDEQKLLQEEIKQLNLELRTLGQYYSTRKVWKDYCRTGRSEEFYQNHKSEIDIHQNSMEKVKEIYGEEKLPDVKSLKARKQKLVARKNQIDAREKRMAQDCDTLKAMLQSMGKQEIRHVDYQKNI